MVRKSIIGLLGVSAIVAICVALWKAWGPGTRSGSSHGEWDNAPFPVPPVLLTDESRKREPEPSRAQAIATLDPWVEPVDGACPASHPIKAKLSSGIYHSPGGMNYERTHPDRCYVDGAAAERDGLRSAKL
jgi:hypothetical protein